MRENNVYTRRENNMRDAVMLALLVWLSGNVSPNETAEQAVAAVVKVRAVGAGGRHRGPIGTLPLHVGDPIGPAGALEKNGTAPALLFSGQQQEQRCHVLGAVCV